MILRKMTLLSAAIMMLGAMPGCRLFSYPSQKEELKDNQPYWFEYDATKRGSFLLVQRPGDQREVHLISEPAPDVALETVSSLIGSLSYQGAKADVQAQLAEKIVELGGRTQAVLVLREALFRISEMLINGKISKEDANALFKQAIEACNNIALADVKKHEAKEKEAAAEGEKHKAAQKEAEAESEKHRAKQKEAEAKIKTMELRTQKLDAIFKIQDEKDRQQKLKTFLEGKDNE